MHNKNIHQFLIYAFSFFLSVGLLSCSNQTERHGVDNASSDSTAMDMTTWTDYENAEYNISLKLPKNWVAVENTNLPGDNFVINIVPNEKEEAKHIPLSMRENPAFSYIAIFPEGIGQEMLGGRTESFTNSANKYPAFSFDHNPDTSKVYLLENGNAWAYFAQPETLPAGWNEYGFIYAQVGVNNFEATCYDRDTDAIKTLETCAPLEGDRLVRKGTIKEERAKEVVMILEQIQFKEMEELTSSVE